MIRFVNPRNGRGWETSRGDIDPSGFVSVLAMMNGDVVECYNEVDGKWAKLSNGLYLSNGKIYEKGAPQTRPKRKRRK